MKRLPRSVRVKGIDYAVKAVSDDEMKNVKAAPDDIYACCDFDSSNIYLVNSIPLDAQWCALWHEVIHAIASGFESLDLMSENAVETTACNIFQVLRNIGLL